MEMGELR